MAIPDVGRNARRRRNRAARIAERDGWVCWICGYGIDRWRVNPDRRSLTLDHVLPLRFGGGDGDDNLRAAHKWCNNTRGSRGE